MMRKVFSSWGLILVMLISVVGTAAAQSGVDPTVEPTRPPAESTTYQHPIVQILSAYFGRETRPTLPTATPTATETSTETPKVESSETSPVTPSLTPTPTPVISQEELAKQIAMYHQDGMGFGVLVKLYAMAEASIEACARQAASGEVVDPNQPSCEALTVEQLVGEFQDGTGMGQLFKEYGKAALLGVGHVKKALQKQQEVAKVTPTRTPVPGVTATPVPSQDGSALRSQNPSQKSNNGNGNNNGSGNNNNNNNSSKVKTPKPPHGRK